MQMTLEDAESTVRDRFWTRRHFLAASGVASAALLAGCGGGGDEPEDQNGGGNGGGNDNGNGGGNGNGNGGGNGGGTFNGDLTGAIGDRLAGERAAMMVEYVRPVTEVLDYSEMPRTDESGVYGTPKTVDDYIGRGLARSGESFYGVGLAIKNVSEFYIDVATVLLMNETAAEVGVFPGRSQRLTMRSQGRGSGSVLAPGEMVRGELVFALGSEPANYTLIFDPRHILTGATERFEVDLSTGSEATASFSQDVSLSTMGQSVAVGDFDVTLHDVSFVDYVADSPYQDIFGPREGYQYVVFDVSATRTSEEMIGQDWSLGVVDSEGYTFSWRRIYQDAMELNRTPLEDLAVGETIEHTLLAFPLSTDFEPVAVSMTAPGPFEPPTQYSADVGTDRHCWSLI